MPRMLELIRASALPSHQMMSASKGALRLPAAEMVEILVYLAENNKIFGETARLTLAGWDEASAKTIAADPHAPSDVLHYWLSPKNIRAPLFPIVTANPVVKISKIAELAVTLKGELLDVLIASPRVRNSPQVLHDLSSNKHLSGTQAARVRALIAGGTLEPEIPAALPEPRPQNQASPDEKDAAEASKNIPASDAKSVGSSQPSCETQPDQSALHEVHDPETDTILHAFLEEHAQDIATDPEKPFHAIGGVLEEMLPAEEPTPAAMAAAAAASPATVTPPPANPLTPQSHPLPKTAVNPKDDKRDSVLQKINKLDIKGRIQLAMKGTKEERSLLVRDGTKIVALAVLESPKISDGEVEKFATQKNVLEAVLRAIPMKRRFAKNYAVVRGLVFNPRTPLDVALGLMKNLLIADLKNLSGNKEVAETVRKLALRMFKQKQEAANK
jgi:hypothetical protein